MAFKEETEEQEKMLISSFLLRLIFSLSIQPLLSYALLRTKKLNSIEKVFARGNERQDKN